MTSAVVFGYHHVGVRGLKALLACGIDVKLVVTHQDNPSERIWFPSMAAAAADFGIPSITPDDPHEPSAFDRIASCQPDFIFSLYYRQMLKPALLDVPRRREFGGAFNVHGSLLPKYRGRVPVNWAVIHGETETGATLHVMDAKPDHGAIVDQCAVPILPDDTAAEVFNKVTVAAEIVLVRSVPRLVDGSVVIRRQDLSRGAYFGGRKPEDGRIPAAADAARIHNLVRALAPPFPGAFFDTAAGRVVVWRTQCVGEAFASRPAALAIVAEGGGLWLLAGGGGRLRILDAAIDGSALTLDDPRLPLEAIA